METVRFRHAHFSARFPVCYRYSPSHFWLTPFVQNGTDKVSCADKTKIWRIGFTKFATRMLGELVELTVDVQVGDTVRSGQRLGTVEGFKAVSELFCVADGVFQGVNPALDTEACLTHSDPYVAGWLYAVEGEPESGTLDVNGYVSLLTDTIDRLQESRYHDSSKNHASEE